MQANNFMRVEEVAEELGISKSHTYKIVHQLNAELQKKGYLHTLTMTELFQTVYMSRPPVAEGLLYTGAYILAGAPKIGKSFLVAQIACHVSTGQDLWGYKVHGGTVLYLALEDDFQRIQSRMFMMYGVNDTPNLHFATTAGKTGNGLDEQLENFMREHPDTKRIIIDTMQKIREVGGEAYSYASDYEITGRIKQFADQHGICVLTVHHTRKQQADDSFETLSGTTGLLGCTDGSLLMQKKKRTDLDATIKVVGRDPPDQILYLEKDPRTQCWNLERMENELHKEPPDPVLETIAQPVKESWSGSPTELVSFLQIDVQCPIAEVRFFTLIYSIGAVNYRFICFHDSRKLDFNSLMTTLVISVVELPWRQDSLIFHGNKNQIAHTI